MNDLRALADRAFDDGPDNPLAATQALVVSHDGEIVFERYAAGFDRHSSFISWSMAKSVLSALCGVLVGRGDLALDEPAAVPEWQAVSGDPRSAITARHLLEMRSGLAWNEDYVDAEVSDVIEMLFGTGMDDMAGYAASKALASEPGTTFNYSSGTSNIISRIVGTVLGGRMAVERTLVDELLVPAGMRGADLTFDSSQTWVGSSYLHATARDFLAFGELYRNDGIAAGGRLLPEGWVASSVAEHSVDEESGQGYGLHWWTARDGHGSFAANGYEGQRIQVAPRLGLTFVRLGKTPAEHSADLRVFYRAIVECFA